MSGMAQLNLKNQLTHFVKQKIEKIGLTLDSHSVALMNRMISHAIDRMVLAKAVEHPGHDVHPKDIGPVLLERLRLLRVRLEGVVDRSCMCVLTYYAGLDKLEIRQPAQDRGTDARRPEIGAGDLPPLLQ